MSFGILEQEHRIACKYNPTYSIGKNIYIVLHVFQKNMHHESMLTNNQSNDNTTTKVGLHDGDYMTVSQHRRVNGGLYNGLNKTVV